MSEELLPCPFCGEPYCSWYTDETGDSVWFCRRQDYSLRHPHPTHERLVKAVMDWEEQTEPMLRIYTNVEKRLMEVAKGLRRTSR